MPARRGPSLNRQRDRLTRGKKNSTAQGLIVPHAYDPAIDNVTLPPELERFAHEAFATGLRLLQGRGSGGLRGLS